jgi:hypothetical protein
MSFERRFRTFGDNPLPALRLSQIPSFLREVLHARGIFDFCTMLHLPARSGMVVRRVSSI